MNLRRLTRTISDRVNQLAEIFAAVLLLAMVLVVILQVAGRYALDMPPSWSEEAARILMIWAGLLGASSAYRRGLDPRLMKPLHVSQPLMARLLRIGRFLATMLIVLPLILHGPAFVARNAFRETETIGINSALVVVIVPMVALLIAIHALADLIAPSATREHAGSLPV